jgi:acylphosphatase
MRAIVSGYVQGVGFRMWAQRRARALGLVGYARNLQDGSVEVVGDGSRAQLERYVATLRRGPESADVRSLQLRWETCAGEFDRFEIRH